ncbi:MAG: DUF4351 domain-containing protein [Candidatus Accumulibacter sp.]|nr:DUF4351 domain-containing protein [Accumulibacter sp.]
MPVKCGHPSIAPRPRFLARQLSRRYGPLPEWARERLRRADAAQREAWADAVLDAASLAEVVGAPPDSH